jgi:hypothetical protein
MEFFYALTKVLIADGNKACFWNALGGLASTLLQKCSSR